MGCAGLLTVPWGFREEEMVRELIGEPPNQYHQTLWAHPESWTRKTWQQVYGFRKGGAGLTTVRPTQAGTPLSSYLAHLYHQFELLSQEEVKSWTAQDKIWSYGDTESEADIGESESDQREQSPDQPPPTQQTPIRPIRAGVKRKHTPRTPEGETRGTQARRVEPELDGMDDPETPCIRIIAAAREVHHHISIREYMLEAISDLVGCSTRSKLVDAVQTALTNSNRIRELEATERRLTQKKKALQDQIKVQEEQIREANKRATASARAVTFVREALALPADVVNKARLFEDRVNQEEPLSRNKIIRFLVDQASSMEQTLEEMRTLADNMVLDEVPSPDLEKGKQPSSRPDSSQAPEVTNDPGAGPSSQTRKLRRKTIVVSDSEPEEAEVATAVVGGEASQPAAEDELEPEEENQEAPQSAFKTPKLRPWYKSTPLGKEATPTGSTAGSPQDH